MLPYALQDEWVQYAYPDGAAAVYNIAQISQGVSENDSVSSDAAATPFQIQSRRILHIKDLAKDVSKSSSGSSSGSGEFGKQSKAGSNSKLLQTYVAVKAGHAADFLNQFHQHFTAVPAYADSSSSDRTSSDSTSSSSSNAASGNNSKNTKPVKQAQTKHTAPHSQASPRSSANDTCKHRDFMLYLGMNIPLTSGGGTVSQEQLQHFLANKVTPKVKGFTILGASGFWEGVAEPTTVLEIISDDDQIAAVVVEIAAAYKRWFKQESVLIKEHACPNVLFL